MALWPLLFRLLRVPTRLKVGAVVAACGVALSSLRGPSFTHPGDLAGLLHTQQAILPLLLRISEWSAWDISTILKK